MKLHRKDKPAGLPKCTLADAGFFGFSAARGGSDRGNMNKVSLSVPRFPAPEPGSFYDGIVNRDYHRAHVPKAREERAEERRDKASSKAREKRALKNSLRLSAKHRAKRLGFSPTDPDWSEAVDLCELEIIREKKGKLQRPAFHGVQGVRKPSPVESRGQVTTGTSGPSRDAPRVQRFAGDGLTPPLRRTAEETFTTTDGGVMVIRQRKPFQKRTAELEGAVEPRKLTGIHPSPVPLGWDRRAKAVDPFIPGK
jgi:hypothetical protein